WTPKALRAGPRRPEIRAKQAVLRGRRRGYGRLALGPAARDELCGKCGGQGGIRTHGRLPPTAVFKTAALTHSATCPTRLDSRSPVHSGKPSATQAESVRRSCRSAAHSGG